MSEETDYGYNPHDNPVRHHFGKFRYCVNVHKSVSRKGDIYLLADISEVVNGTLVFYKLEDDGGRRLTLALSPGSWISAYAANVVDGTPVCGEYWSEEGVSHVPGVCEALFAQISGEPTQPQPKRPYLTRRPRWKIPYGIKLAVLKRDNYTCKMCGVTKGKGVVLELDHILPKSKGGSDEIDNLQILCKVCNRKKWAKVVHIEPMELGL